MKAFIVFSLFLLTQVYAQTLAPAGEAAVFTEISLHEPLMDSTLCDGFDFPVGDKNGTGTYTASNGKKYTGWKASPHGVSHGLKIPLPEAWNGNGGGDTDFGQPVYAVGSGIVISVSKNSLHVEHRFVENGRVRTVWSSYESLGEIKVKQGDRVQRRQCIGSIGNDSTGHAQLVFSISRDGSLEPGSAFIKNHRRIMVPYYKDKLVIVHKSQFKCYLYGKGKLQQTYEIALGQVPVGRKEKQGDLKVPEGEYQICEKAKGPFDTANNWSAAYLGTRWLCLNYPNTYDAQTALSQNRITAAQFKQIEQANKTGVRPPQNTSLGGAVGIHGWIEEDWSNDSDRAQTWGCVSFHNKDLEDFYDRVTLKTTVIIIP